MAINNQNPNQKKGTGFVNLNRITGANTGNRLGETISKGVQAGTQNLNERLNTVKSGFLQESEQKNLASDINKQAATQALQNIGSGQTNVTDQQAQQFGTFLAGQYAGPKELDSAKSAQLTARGQELKGFGQALGSQGDKTQVLEAFAGQGKGPYSVGEKRLDSFLLGKGPNVQQLQKAQQATRGLPQQINREQENARQIGQLREGQAQQFAQGVSGQIGEMKGGIESTVGTEFSRLEGIQKDLYDNITGKLQRDESLSPEERQILSLGDPAVSNKMPGLPGQQDPLLDIYNLDATKYLQKGALEKGSVASAQQKAQLDALSKLSQKDIRDFTDINTKAGQYDPNKPLEFDRAKLTSDAQKVKAQYDSEMKKALGLSLGQQLEDSPNSVLGLAGAALGGITGGALGAAMDALTPQTGFNLYEYSDTLAGMPNLGNMNYEQAVNALNAYEQKIQPFINRVEKGHPEDGGRQSKTKEANLRGAYDQIVPKLAEVKKQLAEYKSNIDKQYGIGRKI